MGKFFKRAFAPPVVAASVAVPPPGPLTVVQSKVISTAAWSGSFASPVTAGNTVFLVASGFSSTKTVISASAPTLGGSPVTGAIKIQEIQSWSSTATVYAATWMLPNCPGGATAVAVTMTGSAAIAAVGLTAYEVNGLGASPGVDCQMKQCVDAKNATSTAVDSAATESARLVNEFVLGVGVNDQSAAAGAAGFTSLSLSANTWTGYQLPSTAGGAFRWQQTASAAANWCSGVVCVTSQPPSNGLINWTFSDIGTSAGGFPGGADGTANAITGLTTRAGSTLVVAIAAYSHTLTTFGLTTITDSANTWTFSTGTSNQNPPAGSAVTGYSALAAIAWVTNASPTTSVTFNIGNTSFDFRATLYEFAGTPSAAVAGAAAVIPNAQEATDTTGSVTLAANGFAVAVSAPDAGWGAVNSPFTIEGGASDVVSAWYDRASAGGVAATFTGILPPDSGTQLVIANAIAGFHP